MAELFSGAREAAEYVVEKTRFVIEQYGPREPGSEAERTAQAFVRQELEPFSDALTVEPFPVSSKAFMAFIPLAGVLMAGSILLYRPFPVLAILLPLAAVFVAFLQFVRYRQFLDPLFRHTESHNVYAVRRAAQTPKRRIVLCGHVDSAYEMRFNLIGRLPLTFATLSILLSLAYLIVLGAARLFFGGALSEAYPMGWAIAEGARFAGLIGSISALFFIRFSVVVPGANDNLTGTFLAVSLFKAFHEQGLRFEETEVGCLVTGSEEAGLRGAKAFVEKHRLEWGAMDTVVIVFDTLRDVDHLAVCVRDLNGTVRNDPGVCALLRQAGQTLSIDVGTTVVYLGSSDATAFTQAGIAATTLSAMDPSPPRYYHTRLDTWTDMDKGCIEKAAAVAWEAVQGYDRAGALPRG